IGTIVPMVGMKEKPIHYYVKDRFLSFYHEVLKNNIAATVDMNNLYTILKGRIDTFLGHMFEKQCEKYILDHYPVEKIGKWIGNTVKKDAEGNIIRDSEGKPCHESTDIDVVALIREGNIRTELFAECKFTNHTVGFQEYYTLQSRIDSTKAGVNRKIVMFSKTGFDERFEEFADNNGIDLVTLEMMFD
ncbi:MAG: DUF234 domain-containing protein, partial [archaeon]|nr:DUF234 domain-containing protein [archaeon]